MLVIPHTIRAIRFEIKRSKKGLLTLIVFFLFTLSAIAESKERDIEAIKNIVYKWSENHNTNNITGFEELYAPTVLFYGEYIEKERCASLKEASLKKKFHQEIITPIQVTFYASGTIKCDFTKQVSYRKKINEYPSYLLLEKVDNNFLIKGESDLITDKNLNIQLNLGAEASDKNYTGLIAVALVVTGLITYSIARERKRRQLFHPFLQGYEEKNHTRNNKEFDRSAFDFKSNSQSPYLEKNSTSKKIVTEDQKLEEEKGRAFEEFVVSKFSKRYYTLVDWRSDKFYNGYYPESNKLPDLLMRLNTIHAKTEFAVECKWRKDFYGGKIVFKDYQLRNYRNYEKEKSLTVFVVLGVGGEPSNPISIYIIPLKEIYSVELTKAQLQQYRRYKTGNFFLYADDMVLK